MTNNVEKTANNHVALQGNQDDGIAFFVCCGATSKKLNGHKNRLLMSVLCDVTSRSDEYGINGPRKPHSYVRAA